MAADRWFNVQTGSKGIFKMSRGGLSLQMAAVASKNVLNIITIKGCYSDIIYH